MTETLRPARGSVVDGCRLGVTWRPVSQISSTIATAVGVFVGTNIDDIIVLTVLFLASRTTGRPVRWHIWAGQYAGIGVLVLASAVAAAGLTIIPDTWVGLLGLVPFALGVRGLLATIRARSQGEEPDPPV